MKEIIVISIVCAAILFIFWTLAGRTITAQQEQKVIESLKRQEGRERTEPDPSPIPPVPDEWYPRAGKG